MKISRQGHGHYKDSVNNQDNLYEEGNCKMVLDGCSDGKYSEVGTRMFAQLFAVQPNRLDPDCFEKTVKDIFDLLVDSYGKWFQNPEKLEEFIMENMLFTIIACFEKEDEFVVKMFGDGYIVTVNQMDHVSYLKFCYGDRPPYVAYKYCASMEGTDWKEYEFKTFHFPKANFKKVGVASDGILPIVKGDINTNFDQLLASDMNAEYSAEGIILANLQLFDDDVTLVI